MNAYTVFKPYQPVEAAAFEHEWRRWVAENILLGATIESIVETLLGEGHGIELIRAELARALEDPYLAAAKRLTARLDKREWVLAAIAKAAALDPRLATIERAHAPSAETFLRDYWAAHRPVLMTGLIDHWPARTLWSLDHLDATLGDREIEVQTRRESDPRFEIDCRRFAETMPLAAFVDRLRTTPPTNDFYVTANNAGRNRAALAPLLSEIGGIPGILADGGEQAGYVWIGPKGTVTPFHHDLTHNLLLQLVGRKRVTLVPSWEGALMRNLLHCFSGWSGPDAIRALPAAERPLMLDVVIGPGEALYLPVGWWHHVEGLDTTIGMSFTGFAWDNDYAAFYRTYNEV